MGALVVIGLAGTLLRVAYTVGLAQHVGLGITDAAFYDVAANLLAEGEGYVDLWRSFEEGQTARTAHHPPGWPALLSISSLAGFDTELAHRLVGAVVGGLVVIAVGLLARHVAGPAAGVAAALLAALHPTLVAADGSLMSETLAGLLVLVVVVLGLRAARTPTVTWALALGAGVGLAALVRGEGLLHLGLVGLPVAVAVARRADGRRVLAGARVLALVAAGTVAVIAPWTLRNAAVLGEPIPISTNDSTVLAGANCDPTYAGPGIGGWDLSCVQRGGAGEVADADAWREQGFDHIRENLDRLPTVVTVRVLRTWGAWDPLAADAEGRHEGTQRAGNLVWLVLLLPAAVTGAVVLARRGRRLELALLCAPVAAGTIVSVVGFGMLRFRHPIELSAVVLAGVAVDAAFRRRPRVAMPDAAVVGS